MYFSKIQGHRGVLSLLGNLVEKDDLDGFYLFSGPKSSGKYTVARQLAKYITCTGVHDDTCRCESCRLFPDSPDYLEISDQASSVKTDDVKAIDSFLSLVPFKSPRRVVLVDDADRLYYSAADKLLKTLEELKKRCTVIFVTSRPEGLSDTIKSRAYSFEFSSLTPEEAITVLQSKGFRADSLGDLERAIPYVSGGILQDPRRYVTYMKEMPTLLKKLASGKDDEITGLVKNLEEKDDIFVFTEALILLLNDIIKVHYDNPDRVTNVSLLEAIETLTPVWTEEVCIASLTKLSDAVRDMKSALNLKKRSRLESSLAWMCFYLSKDAAKKVRK